MLMLIFLIFKDSASFLAETRISISPHTRNVDEPERSFGQHPRTECRSPPQSFPAFSLHTNSSTLTTTLANYQWSLAFRFGMKAFLLFDVDCAQNDRLQQSDLKDCTHGRLYSVAASLEGEHELQCGTLVKTGIGCELPCERRMMHVTSPVGLVVQQSHVLRNIETRLSRQPSRTLYSESAPQGAYLHPR